MKFCSNLENASKLICSWQNLSEISTQKVIIPYSRNVKSNFKK